MIYELNPDDFENTSQLFAAFEADLAVASILAGKSPARVFADDPACPQRAFTWFKSRAFLAGETGSGAFNHALRRMLEETVYPQSASAGFEAILLHYEPAGWEAQLGDLCGARKRFMGRRHYYTCQALKTDWRQLLPSGFSLHPVDSRLLEKTHLINLDVLVEEMQSERPSVADFLEKSFGYCLIYENELASWCLSEYNQGERCEVGVATVEKYQRQGLATVATLALLEHAFSTGIQQVGWHCWANNAGSIALALKAGFAKTKDYPVCICLLEAGDGGEGS